MIETLTNPADNSEVVVVSGVIEQTSCKAIENDKYNNTHKFGVRIGDDWVNNINVKTPEGRDPQLSINTGTRQAPDWKRIEVGDDVRIVVNPNEYNGKTYYNSGVSKITLVKKGSGASQQSTGASKAPYKGGKKDDTGMRIGHSQKGAVTLYTRFQGDLIEHGKLVEDVTRKIHPVYKESSGLNDYESGQASGNAVLNACYLCKQPEDLEKVAMHLLNTFVPAMKEYITESNKPAEPETVQQEPVFVEEGEGELDIPF